ncbi:MAG: S9 family peptidase [Prevotella sp.]|jgi:dipeptidyl aminopeptidase/acylaminoacyl peptidase
MKKSLIISFAVLAMLPAVAQKRAFTIEDIYRVKYVTSPTVSRDGVLAYGVTRQDLKAQKTYSNITVQAPEPGSAVSWVKDEPQQITTDDKSFSPFWSQDGKCLYHLSYADGTTQVYRYEHGQSVKITDYALGIQGPVLSPDGNLIAFAAEVFPEIGGADGKANKSAMEKKAKNPIQAHVADELLFRHWTDYTDGRYWHIIVYDMTKKTYTDVTPGKFHSPVFSPSGPSGFVFSPDSKEICYLSNHDDHPEASTNCDLWIVPVTGGEARNITAENKAWDGSPQYSPDGRYIAYRFQRTPGYESDRFILGLYDRKTGEKRVLTEHFDNWVDSYKWADDSKSIYFLGEERGYEPLYQVSLRNNKMTKLIDNRAITSFDVDARGNFYYTYSTTGRPSELFKASTSRPKGVSSASHREGMRKGWFETAVTHLNDSLVEVVDFRPSEQMWVKGAEGDSIHVFVVKPHGFDASKKYPLVINVHGGPQMQWMDSYRADWQVYPGAGYVVAYPNPHGSTGYGQQFCRDISGSWGGRPYEDVMAVTDALAQLEYVDSTRMGAMGWSYGGYFMNWLQGQTGRFKCLASMMGLFDLEAMWGTTEELWFPNFDLEGQPWNSPLYKKWSPSEYLKNFSTPTLIITGERDYRVSYNQSLQYFTTLQTLGIPSRLIIFDNDGHWPNSLKSMPLYYNAHLEWFEKYLGGGGAPWDTKKMVMENPYETSDK